MEITGETLGAILGALAEQLGSLGERVEMFVIGGSALTALAWSGERPETWTCLRSP
jgi:hypothetical protein